MEVDCDIGDWPGTNWDALAERIAAFTASIEPALHNARLTVSVLFTSDDEIHALNLEWRKRNKPTNVLSFPMLTRRELQSLDAVGPPVLLGDIALAYETCSAEADEKDVALQDHAAHLLVHGFLHLAGHDHQDDAAAETMERLEIEALAKLGIADPYSIVE